MSTRSSDRRCYTCNRSGAHDSGCPESMDSREMQKYALAEYRRGWDEGRGGDDCLVGQSASYNLGWGNGMCALEEAENGCP